MAPLSTMKRLVMLLAVIVLEQSCRKQFLDTKPSSTLVVPTTLSQLQALLDNTGVFGLVPTLGEASADNYWFPNDYWNGLDPREKNAYVWAPDIFTGQGGQLDWNIPYQQVYYANIVLDGLSALQNNPDSISQLRSLKGSAFFLRAFAFYNVAQLFAPPYDSARDNSYGIPLRLHADVTVPSKRSTVWQTYQQIINDLDSAAFFLPATLPNNYRNRPNWLAGQAMLARVYLSMRDYRRARAAADAALQSYSTLIDYNTLSLTKGVPIITLNLETLYQASFLSSAIQQNINFFSVLVGGFYPNTRVDLTLIQSYETNDLRRLVYFHFKPPDSSYLKGSYTGTNFPFGGLATDELYLIRAEGAARAGDAASAMQDINTLLRNRWKTDSFPGYTVSSAQEALDTVLLERRKELAFRGLRWTDLRRLNLEGYNITLTRPQNKDTLYPNSNLYALPIPPDVITLSGMAQNPR